MAITIKPQGKNGRVVLIDDNPKNKDGYGRAVASKTHPGYVTITMSIPPYALRVPADWVKELESGSGT